MDQSANLLGNLWSSTAWSGSPAPIETEAGAVPTYHGVGFHENQDVRPAGPTLAKCRPKESVPGVQSWPRPFAFQHGDLLAEGEDFESGIASTAKTRMATKKERMISSTKHLLTRRKVASPTDAPKSQAADFKRSSAFVYGQEGDSQNVDLCKGRQRRG